MKKFIPILSCVVIYLALLFSAFSTPYEVETYVCYTTSTGECYHADYCQYLYASKHKTTVYQVEKNYRKCSRCNPFDSKYKTTITINERNYIIPAIISVSIYVTIILINKKRNTI